MAVSSAEDVDITVCGQLGEVALSAPADVVTGNLGHFQSLEGPGVPVLTPAEFMDGLEHLMRRQRGD